MTATSYVTNTNHNNNYDKGRSPYNEQELRFMGLREALNYFAYVQRTGASGYGAAAPAGALTVLGMADHFAAYIATGEKPERPE